MIGTNGDGRWLRGVSGVMAVFCGGVAVLLLLAVLVTTASTATAQWSKRPVDWRVASGGASASVHMDHRALKSCRPGEARLCEDHGPADPQAFASALLGQAVVQLPLAALAYGLFQASACFAGLARGRLLARSTTDRLVRFAAGGLVFVLTAPFAGRLGALATDGARKLLDTLGGDRAVLFSITTYDVNYAGVSNLLTMIYAVTLTVIAVVMVKASTIADDHAQIV